MPIEPSDLDNLQAAYKAAVDRWVAAIRAEEALATPDHSIRAWDLWEQAGFNAKDAQDQASVAKDAYIDGLRKVDYDM